MADTAPTDAGDSRSRGILAQMIFGFRSSAVLHAAAQLEIADTLAEGPKTGDELAAATSANPQSLLRLLRALAALGIVDEIEPGSFQLASLGHPLRKDAPGSMAGMAAATGGDSLRVWGHLLHSVRTGETAFDDLYGMSGFEYFARNPEIGAAFNERMAEGTRLTAPGLLRAYDFSQFTTILDAGGGNGTLLAAILAALPGPRGILFDTAGVVQGAGEVLKAAGVGGRCEIVAGDFFNDPLPRGADAYVLKHVIHDWDDEKAITILKRCREAIASGGRLLLVEGVMPERVEQSEMLRMLTMGDINMLLNTGGRERTESEFRALFAASGFSLSRVIPVEAPWPTNVVEGVPV